jgi:glycosyltransferase involved in cell wall biosynthesis
LKIAIVLPAISLFSATRPNSMETVIRTLTPHAGPDETIRIFCDAGVDDHGDLDVQTIPNGPARMSAMVKAIKAYDPDIIEFHQHVQSASHIARRFPGKTRLLYRHNDVKAPRSLIGRWRYAHRHQPFEGFVFVSDASRQTFVRDYPSLADRAFTIRNPIDAEQWRDGPGPRENRIVFAGRAIPEKGLDLLCEALPGVLNAHPEWRATLFLGDWSKHADWAGPHVKRMLAQTDQVDIHRDGTLAQVQACMKSAAIAVVPSVWAEPLGLSALEAHAAGAALISSGRGGLREASGPHALYVEPLTVDTIAKAVALLINDDDRRMAMARSGQQFVETHHTPAVRAAELARLRRQLVGIPAA